MGQPNRQTLAPDFFPLPLLLSTPSSVALVEQAKRWSKWCGECTDDWQDVLVESVVGRTHFRERLALWVDSGHAAKNALLDFSNGLQPAQLVLPRRRVDPSR